MTSAWIGLAWFVIYWITFVIWVWALHRKCPRRVSGPSILIALLVSVLCCCVAWPYMLWVYFASDAAIPDALLRPQITEAQIVDNDD